MKERYKGGLCHRMRDTEKVVERFSRDGEG